MPAAFARSCKISIDALTGRGSMAVQGVTKTKRNQMIKELRSLDIIQSKSSVTTYEVLFSDRRTFMCSSTIW